MTTICKKPVGGSHIEALGFWPAETLLKQVEGEVKAIAMPWIVISEEQLSDRNSLSVPPCVSCKVSWRQASGGTRVDLRHRGMGSSAQASWTFHPFVARRCCMAQ